MNEKDLKDLLKRYTLQQCTKEEEAWIETWYNDISGNSSTNLSSDIVESDLQKIFLALPKKRRLTPHIFRIAATIILISGISFGLYDFLRQETTEKQQTAKKPTVDNEHLSPFSSSLKLADGRIISLKDIPVGLISDNNGIKITKIKDGLISYTVNPHQNEVVNAPGIQILTTGKGSQYQVLLADGTKVWLNAVTTLKFPSSFEGKNREVEIAGEGYFEVKKNIEQPFKVKAKRQEIVVLGTHFNVNSYEEEPITRTTLLEGSISVIQLKTKNSRTLKPGEQSSIEDNKKIHINHVNASDATAWKRGLFQFYDSDIQSVSRQLSRWYDTEIEFNGPIPETKLWGEFHRNETLEKALEILTYFDIKYTIVNDGKRKKIIISNND